MHERPSGGGGRRTECALAKVTSNVLLTPLERRLLSAFLERVNEVLTERYLLRTVWGMPADCRTNVLAVGLMRLRRKLGECCPEITAVKSVGYKMTG